VEQKRKIKDMNKLKVIVLLTTLMILLGCGGPQRERKMKMAKFKREQSDIKPISIDRDVVKNEDTVSVITTTMYTNEDFEKLEEMREKRSVKRKQK
tara:strand:- start:2128 stop:2415 length:288 start_codon:yes stop_codon:yes gene_type:complete